MIGFGLGLAAASGQTLRYPRLGGQIRVEGHLLPAVSTTGPLDPSWSPDGSRLALTADIDRNLDIALVSAEGGAIERLTKDPHVDIQPAWSADGQSLFFVTGRGGSLDIYRLDLASGEKTPVVSGQRHDIQPSVSPVWGCQRAFSRMRI